jgi:hypothetical protein
MKHALGHRRPAQVTVLTAVVMVAILGMVALVVDAGILWETQRDLQWAADSAALAGVAKLPGDTSQAVTVAGQFATQNSGIAAALCSATPTTTATPGQWVPQGFSGPVYTLTVSIQCNSGFTFGRVLGLTQVPNDCQCVRANATAVIGSVSKPDCPLPFAISDGNEGLAADGVTPVFAPPLGNGTLQDMTRNGFGYTFGQPVALHVDNADASFGNFHAIDLGNGSGGSVYSANIAGHCQSVSQVVTGGTVSSEPGDMNGPTQQGLEDRGLVSCSGSGAPSLCRTNPQLDLACPDSPGDVLNADGSVRRDSLCVTTAVVTMPFFDVAHGRTDIKVEGFGEFFLEGWDKNDKTVWGMFVKNVPTLGDLGAYDPLGSIVIRLVR